VRPDYHWSDILNSRNFVEYRPHLEEECDNYFVAVLVVVFVVFVVEELSDELMLSIEVDSVPVRVSQYRFDDENDVE